jgi:hypothetical protein
MAHTLGPHTFARARLSTGSLFYSPLAQPAVGMTKALRDQSCRARRGRLFVGARLARLIFACLYPCVQSVLIVNTWRYAVVGYDAHLLGQLG